MCAVYIKTWTFCSIVCKLARAYSVWDFIIAVLFVFILGHIDIAQGLLLFPSSEITLGRFRGPYGMPGI